jgi:hypothetical protein
MNSVIIQGVVYVALIFVLLSFQRNKRVSILLTMLVGLVLFVVHYSLLHAWTGALLNLLEAGVVYVSFAKETNRWAQRAFWPYLFCTLIVVAGFMTSKSYVDWLPAVAQLFGTFAVWQKNPRYIRFIMLAPRPLWFLYNLSVGSQAGMVAEVFILLSVLTGIVRFDILSQKEALAR